ncbi:TctA family transporter [Hoeflea marina]|uniref:TctA family transporter n=1 Tax=Hoeflea marina TaxID=274592 RepID=A0A317PRC2_9HYPH|nr:tripartite tricarboxylate transporter permease [Hoeflea marina]PWW03497.1 TctA family transporter [Hoeflea marina]
MDAWTTAIAGVTEPFTLLMLVCGVVVGLVIGVIPGLGGIFGMALLVPLTYTMDSYAAFALLLGMGSVITTSDTIPAVLIGVPGSIGAIATVEDGFPLARQNQAARAFGAAYSASLIGGLFGALVLALSIPVMRPLMLLLKSPDFLAISLFGLFFVAMLAGPQPLKGVIAALGGVLMSFVGIDDQSAVARFTFGTLYLWDGLPIGIVFLGLFGLPALMDLSRRTSISGATASMRPSSMLVGLKDTLREWRLVLQCSSLGSMLGAIPGIGLPVIEWVAYGMAKRDRKGGPEFGEGNIRGVIGPESANNAKEGGSLIPTIAFGLPGSATMSILLGAFMVQGLVPGPAMMTTNLPITYSLILFVALANILGASLCLGLTNPLARIALLPSTIIIPVALVFVTLGAFQTHASFADIVVLVGFGILGHFMAQGNWPRAAFSLGFVLGPSIERYFFLSYQIVGTDWIYRPSIQALILLGGAFAIRKTLAWRRARRAASAPGAHRISDMVAIALLSAACIFVIVDTWSMPDGARRFPTFTAILLLVVVAALAWQMFLRDRPRAPWASDATARLARRNETMKRMLVPVHCVLFASLVMLAGLVVAVPIFVLTVIWSRNRLAEQPTGRAAAVIAALSTTALSYGIFGWLISVPWPRPLLWF